MNRLAASLILLITVLTTVGLVAGQSLRAQEFGPELARATKAMSKKGTARKLLDPPPEFPAGATEVDFGGWGEGAWSAESGTFGEQVGPQLSAPDVERHVEPQQRPRSARRQNVRPMHYQQPPAGEEAVDVGNIPVPGAEEDLGPTTQRAKRYQQHAIMYDDAEQANARERTVRNFHGGRPTNNNNEFGDFAYEEPTLDGPDLQKAGFYGYGPDHNRCFGSGRCGRDVLCCEQGDCGTCGGGGCGGGCCDCGNGGCGSCDSCGGCCGHASTWWENLTVSGGVQGFKSPIDRGRNGNFGLREGVNWGIPIWQAYGIGGQLGINALQSDLSGNNVVGQSSEARSQVFITAGLFRRALIGQNWQGGVAYDYLHDDYYITNDLHKIRAELSYVASNNDDIGAWVSVGLNGTELFNSVFNNNNSCWTSNDLYAFFWRRTLSNGTVGRAWAGFSGSGDGMLGGELRIPFTNRLALEANVNYLIPGHSSDQYGAGTEEGWNVAIGVAWYPGSNSCCSTFSPWRPLFGVADNSIFPYTRK